jgi:hypothetical protein
VGELAREFLGGSLDLLVTVFVIVVPIMVLLELFEGTRPYRVMVHWFARLVGRWLGLREEAAAPTLVGVLFGLAYAGGVIVRDTERHGLGRRQVFLMSVFLSMVHAIFEDSLIFITLGASVFWIVIYRTAWAALVTLALGAIVTILVRRWEARDGVDDRADDAAERRAR